ncbi:MAG: ATP-binding cassette domain-containing protein [Fibrobacter sp.]|jgi:ATP-binding cassette subfamily F protein uup|nr:ATP-binding cassette domain-containing protein [Fibrobacter sp.]
MALISVRNLYLRYGGDPLFDGASFEIREKDRVCLMGRNGEGKSTLLKILSGEIEATEGTIISQSGLKVARLIQEVPADIPGTVREIILNHQGGESLDWSAESILGKTGINPDLLYRNLSGGQKRRVLFARALAAGPDLLLLDEPTNHLDIPAIRWLEEIIARLPCAVLFVSHDRAFVRRTANRILELDRGTVRSWDASYDRFVELREAFLENEERSRKLFDKRLAEEEAWIRRGIKARRTRNEGRVRALKKMREERRARRSVQGNVQMQITEAERSGRLVVRAENLTFAWGAPPVVKNFSMEIQRGDRIGIIGENGSGKTTLLRLLLGDLAPDSGTVKLGTNLQIAYFDQMRAGLNESETLVENIGDGQEYVMLGEHKRHVLGYLQDFLFSADRARGPISALSGGEKNRLMLARLFSKPSNVLVLDEPTNDLDMETLDLLQDLIAEYKGTVLIVSHDRDFIDEVSTSVIALENGNVREYIGGYSDFEKQSAAARSTASKPAVKTETPIAPARKKRSYNEQREFDALPAKIETLEAEIAKIQETLADPQIYTNAPALVELQKNLDARETELLEAYARWETLDG